MTGKIWIVILGFSLLVFAALDLVVVYFILTGVASVLFTKIATLRAAFAFLDKSAYGRRSVIERTTGLKPLLLREYFRHG